MPERFRNLLTVMESLMNEFQPQLHKRLDSDEIKGYKGIESIETKIFGEHSLTRFSNGMNNADQPLNTYIGLYSPLLFFTPMGLGWLIKKFISYSDDKETRETVYLLIKFLDKSSTDFFARNKKVERSYSESNRCHDKPKYTEKEFLDNAIKEFADEKLSTEQREIPAGNTLAVLQHFVHLIQMHHDSFRRKKLEAMVLKEFLRRYDIISFVSYEYFQRLIFTNTDNISLIESSITLIRNRYWLDEPSILGKVITVTCKRCQDEGLNRWEYYVGKPENNANQKRKVWWECYWWDRWFSVISGKPPSITDDMHCCLFPREVIELGVDETMNCLFLINSINLDPDKLGVCVSFGYILLAKITSKVFALLYNRKFTDYRLISSQNSVGVDGLLHEMQSELQEINKVFDRLEEKFIPFLISHSNVHMVSELYGNLQFVTVCSFQAIESLLLRVQGILTLKKSSALKNSIVESRDRLFRQSINTLLTILKLEDKLISFKCFWSTNVALLVVVSHFISHPRNKPLYYFSLIFGVVNFYCELLDTACENVNADDSETLMSWEKLKHGVALFLILTRMCSQVHMKLNSISQTQFIEVLMDCDKSCSNIGKLVLDINSLWYKNIINNKHQSGFTKIILDHINKNFDDFSRATSTADVGTDSEVVSPNLRYNLATTSIASFESFTNSEIPSVLIDSLWGDIVLDIFDDPIPDSPEYPL